MYRRSAEFFVAALVVVSFSAVCRADNRVLVIGIDGAGGRYMQPANTPNLNSLAAKGAARYDWLNEAALIPNPPANYGSSGVNWATINTGASAAHHGVTSNTFSGNNFANYPHWFKYVKDHDPTKFTASIVDWAPINTYVVPNQYADLEIQPSGSSDVIIDGLVRDNVVSLLNTGDPDAIFVQFDSVDGAGHTYGWGTPQYNARLQAVDGLVGDIMTALNARPGVVSSAEDWLVMVVGDHGGYLKDHSASQGAVDWEVPFIISGPSVLDGLLLEQGTLRDVVPTALWHLGINPLPTTVDGKVVGVPESSVALLLFVGVLCLGLFLGVRRFLSRQK